MSIFRRRKFESEMEAELRFHLESYRDDLVRSGMDPREAERQARLAFGTVEATKDQCRQAWGLERLDELRADLRYALRGLRRNPGFAAVAVLSLALGTGVNTAIFGLTDAVLLRPLAVRDPAGLVFIQNAGAEGANGGPPYPCFELLRDQASAFQGLAAFSSSNLEVQIDDRRELARGEYVSGNFYDLLGIRPLAGRALRAADDRTPEQGGPDGPVAVISHNYWQRRFGGSREAIGHSFQMGESTVTIVGIMPSGLMSLEPGRPVDIAVPMMLSDAASLRNRGAWWLEVVGRLKPGVRLERARAQADALFQGFMGGLEISPEVRRLYFDRIQLAPAGGGTDALRTRFAAPLAALMLLSGLVLLAACVTVANLMLARATARAREFAIRLAIGAGRGRLIRQALAETLVLMGAGAALGTLLAVQGEAALARYFAAGNNPIVLDLSLDRRLLFFALAIAVATGVACGLVPALRAVRIAPGAGMQLSSRTVSGSRESARTGRALVVLQVGLSMVLLAGAGLFLRSLRQLQSVDPGFARQGVLTMDVAPEHADFGSVAWMTVQRRILDTVGGLPGVRSASWSSMTPLNGRDRGEVLEIPGYSPPTEEARRVHLAYLSPEYLATLGTPLLKGRNFTARDRPGSPAAALVNESAARFYFGQGDAIGRKIVFAHKPGKPAYEIVGVVRDSRHQGPRGEPWRFVYLPVLQAIDPVSRLTLSVRTAGNPQALAVAVVKSVQAARSTLLVSNISTIEKQVELSLMKERLVSTLSTAFAAVALVLSCIGLYGMLAYAVARRTAEMGIRMALGATAGQTMRLILREALILAGSGILLGIVPVAGIARLAHALLFGVTWSDPFAFAGAILILLVFAALAAAVPARRAGRLDPMTALRCD